MRESGPVSKVLEAEGGADHSPAKEYISLARTFLGTLKNQMDLGGLAQGKLTRRLEDGTIIVVTSVAGQDKISITVPTPAPPPPPVLDIPVPEIPPEPEWEPGEYDIPFETDQFGVCGYATFFVEGFSTRDLRAWVWKPGDDSVTAIPGPSGARSWWANAISGDGRTVVGAWISTADGVQRAYRWSSADGPQDLGSVASGSPLETEAFGVDSTGSIVVGSGPSDPHTAIGCNWVWTGGALQPLPGSRGYRARVKVSPNGKFIFGTITEQQQTGYSAQGGTGGGGSPSSYWQPTFSQVPRGAVWHGSSAGAGYAGPSAVPYSGQVLTIVMNSLVSGLGPAQVDLRYSILPGNVSNNGDLCGNGPNATYVSAAGAVASIGPTGAITSTPFDPNGATLSGPSAVSEAIGITADGGRVAGNLVSEDSTFVWTNGQLDTGQPSSGDGLLYDMSRDGNRYCGATTAFDDDGKDALYWAEQRRTVIPRMTGSEDQIATGVASRNVRIPPIPPKPIPINLV